MPSQHKIKAVIDTIGATQIEIKAHCFYGLNKSKKNEEVHNNTFTLSIYDVLMASIEFRFLNLRKADLQSHNLTGSSIIIHIGFIGPIEPMLIDLVHFSN